MKVISLNLAHINACIELDNVVLNGLWNKEQWQKELSDSRRLCIGGIDSSRLLAIACGWLIVDEVHLTVIAVHPEYRRKGIGRSLLLTLFEKARSKGAVKATLEVSSENIAAKALYKSLGFEITGSRDVKFP